MDSRGRKQSFIAIPDSNSDVEFCRHYSSRTKSRAVSRSNHLISSELLKDNSEQSDYPFTITTELILSRPLLETKTLSRALHHTKYLELDRAFG